MLMPFARALGSGGPTLAYGSAARPGRSRSQVGSDRVAEGGRAEAEGQAEDDVDDGAAPFLACLQLLGVEHPGREGRVGAEQADAGEEIAVAPERASRQHTQYKGTADVDDEDAVGEPEPCPQRDQ